MAIKIYRRRKVLLEWHYRFGHLRIQQVQYMLKHFPFVQLTVSGAAKCDPPVCEICEFANAFRHPKQALTMAKCITHGDSLKIGDLYPGSIVSADHYSWGIPLTLIVDHQQTNVLVGVSFLTMYLAFFTWIIMLVSLK